jgi:hypothetical protein
MDAYHRSQGSTSKPVQRSTQQSGGSSHSQSAQSGGDRSGASGPATTQGSGGNRSGSTSSPQTTGATAGASSATQVSRSGAVASVVSLTRSQAGTVTEVLSGRPLPIVANINFPLSIGTAVPSSVTLLTVPGSIFSVIPEFRGYRFFLSENEVAVVDPDTHRIVAVIPRNGRQVQALPQQNSFSELQRAKILTYARGTCATTADVAGVNLVAGSRVPAGVQTCGFGEMVSRDIGAARPYEYFEFQGNVLVTDPSEKTIVDIIH